MFDQDWQKEKYEEVFETTIRQTRIQREMDPNFRLDDIRARLKDLYIREGHGWEGKGIVIEIVEAATIAAYEHLLAEWGQKGSIGKIL
jgi:hypothetical protein